MRCNKNSVLTMALAVAVVLLGGSVTTWAISVWEKSVAPRLQSEAARKVKLAQTPTEAIKELDRQLDDYRTGDHLSADDVEHNRLLKRKILGGTFDIRELCRISLGSHWPERTALEQDHLVSLMTSLLEEKAVTSKEQGQQRSKSKEVYSVRYMGDTALGTDKQRAQVKTTVHVPSRNITIELFYKVRRAPSGGWKIYDVIVDGSSLVENYAYQFDTIITKDGYPELVHRMEKKLDEMHKK